MPWVRIHRLRATQVHRQRRVLAAQAVAAGAHVDRGKGVDGFRGGGRTAFGHLEGEAVPVLGATQVQVQGVADHLVIAHDAFEHFPQAATGDQRITQCVEGRGADKPRHP
ncbi:hypothetical protein D3C78_770350 [compost metagenome]